MRNRVAHGVRCVSTVFVLSSLLVACAESEAPEVVNAPTDDVSNVAGFGPPTVGTPYVEVWISPDGSQPTKTELPRYPALWLYSGFSGEVTATVRVAADGSASEVSWLNSEPDDKFEPDALLSLGRWRFRPSLEAEERETTVNFCFRSGDAPYVGDSIYHQHHRSPPVYPREARKARIEGDVLIRAYVSPVGRVIRQEVLESSSPLFSEAAKKGIARWGFDVVGVSCTEIPIVVPIHFSLE